MTTPQGQIRCPHCGRTFAISDALADEIREHLRAELEQGAMDKARAHLDVELRDLKAALTEKDKSLEDAQSRELQLRKKARELDERQRNQELDIARTLDAEREAIQQEALKRFVEQHDLKDREKDKRIADLINSLDEARRKGAQGSMETQGEVLERSLEERLRIAFPVDGFEPVPKGIKGADLIHRVRGEDGRDCGIILWETKNTKGWSEPWIQKLKDDQVTMRAAVSVIVSLTLPDDITRFGFRGGIWICDVSSAVGLATALRQQLSAVTFERLSSAGKGEKMEALYDYLTGSEFRQKVEAIVDSFLSMRAQLDKEKRAMERIWKEREKQIERVTLNTTGMIGDIRGIAGGTLLEFGALELGPAGEQGTPLEED